MRDFVTHVRRHLSRDDVPEHRYDEVVEEIASELEARYAAMIDRGSSEQDAWNQVLAQIPSWPSLARDLAVAGGRAIAEPRHSRFRSLFSLDRWLHDLRLALRVLRKDHGFTVTGIVTLAICLGGHAAILAGVNAILLHPLRVPEPERILLMANQYPRLEPRIGTVSSTPDYEDRLRHVTAFDEQALYNYAGGTIEIGGVPTRTLGIVATPSLLRLLRISPAHGRIFTEEEATAGNDERVILSDGLWRELYGADPAAVGRRLRLNDRNLTIVGVLPRDATFGGPDVRFWIPLAMTERQRSDNARHNNGWYSIGRLKPEATIEQARAQLKLLDAINLERTAAQLKPVLLGTGFYSSAEPFQDFLVRDVKGSLYALWAASLAVLVIGLGNLANLGLARSRARLPELATRLAIGAGRLDVLRQQLVEGVMIGVTAASAGLALGGWLLSALRTRELVVVSSIQIDSTVVGVTLALGVMAGVLIGLVSAMPLYTMQLGTMLHDGSRGGTRGRAVRATRRTLVVAQMACSFVLLVGAGLLWVSVGNLLRLDPGFAIENVITGTVSLPRPRYAGDDAARALMNQSLESIRRLPGVAAAGATTMVPLRGNYQSGILVAEGQVPEAGKPLVTVMRALVTPGYFEAVGTPLVRGRYFDDRDDIAGARTIIIDERLARRFWPEGDPIGRRVFRPENPKDLEAVNERRSAVSDGVAWLTVIGVVRNAQLRGPIAEDVTNGTIYLPYAVTAPRDFGFVIRTTVDPSTIVGEVRSALAGMDRDVPLFDIRTLSERSDLALMSRTSTMRLASLFAIVAVFLSAIGLYGVLAYLVTQRAREMGVRLALGSTPRAIVALILREGLALAIGGAVLGALGSLFLGRLLQSQLYGVEASNPWLLVLMTLALSAVAALACIVPARRAARVDVMQILSAQ
jgi:predicted permease